MNINLNDFLYFYHPENSRIVGGSVCKVTYRNSLTGVSDKLLTMLIKPTNSPLERVMISEDYIVEISEVLFA